MVGWQGVEQGEHGRHGLLERVVQRQDLPGDLGPDRAEVITILDVTVGFEQVADWQVGGGLAIGDRMARPAAASRGCDATG